MTADVYADAFLRADAGENGAPPQPEKEGSFNHSFRRAIERYGVYVSPKDLLQVIATGNAKFVSFAHSGREVYDVPVDTPDDEDFVWVRVVYAPPDGKHVSCPFGAVITVLPPDWQPVPSAEEGCTYSRGKPTEFHKKQGQRKKNFARDFRRVNADEDDFDD